MESGEGDIVKTVWRAGIENSKTRKDACVVRKVQLSWMEYLDLGDLLLLVALLFTTLIIVFESAERRRESRRERTILDAIDAEYRALYRMGQF